VNQLQVNAGHLVCLKAGTASRHKQHSGEEAEMPQDNSASDDGCYTVTKEPVHDKAAHINAVCMLLPGDLQPVPGQLILFQFCNAVCELQVHRKRS
jgi:hypothetical protein